MHGLVMAPLANTEHQRIALRLSAACLTIVPDEAAGTVYAGLNVSDRVERSCENFRCPDVAVYSNRNPAVDHGPFVHGGPDFAVEIISEGELPHAKLGFYAAVGTHELLVVTRGEPWALELFRLDRGVLKLAGTATPGGASVLSEAVGLTFRLAAGEPRPAGGRGGLNRGDAWPA